MIRKVGVREAKAQLSKILEDVRRGGTWIVTVRGRPVARITPLIEDALSLEERVRRLEQQGIVEPLRHSRPLPPPVPLPEGLAQRWLSEDRAR